MARAGGRVDAFRVRVACKYQVTKLEKLRFSIRLESASDTFGPLCLSRFSPASKIKQSLTARVQQRLKHGSLRGNSESGSQQGQVHQQVRFSGAGDGNRTHVRGLGSRFQRNCPDEFTRALTRTML